MRSAAEIYSYGDKLACLGDVEEAVLVPNFITVFNAFKSQLAEYQGSTWLNPYSSEVRDQIIEKSASFVENFKATSTMIVTDATDIIHALEHEYIRVAVTELGI